MCGRRGWCVTDDSVFVVLCRSGGAYQSQLGNDVVLKPGDAVLCDCGYVGGIDMTADLVRQRQGPTRRDREFFRTWIAGWSSVEPG